MDRSDHGFIKNSYASLNLKIKSILCDIIEIAYPGDPDLKKLKSFSYYVIDKTLKTASGYYYPNERRIEVFNLSYGPGHIAKCSIHELSHHVDQVKNHCTGHQKSFYECYAKLIYASLDMGIFTKEDFYDPNHRDHYKVDRILSRYSPRPCNWKMPDIQYVKVYNGFSVKDKLKANGYAWNGLEKIWEKYPDDLEKEIIWLEQQGVSSQDNYQGMPYYRIDDAFSKIVNVDPVVTIEAKGNTFDVKDILKEQGFKYHKDEKKWVKKVCSSKYYDTRARLYKDERLSCVTFVWPLKPPIRQQPV